MLGAHKCPLWKSPIPGFRESRRSTLKGKEKKGTIMLKFESCLKKRSAAARAPQIFKEYGHRKRKPQVIT